MHYVIWSDHQTQHHSIWSNYQRDAFATGPWRLAKGEPPESLVKFDWVYEKGVKENVRWGQSLNRSPRHQGLARGVLGLGFRV